MNKARATRLPRDGRVLDGIVRTCEHPGCAETAAYRAPRGPADLKSYRWFCLDHVRSYNQEWDFFAGWSQAEIEQFQRESVTGHRPTWPLGRRPFDSEARYRAARGAFRAFARDWLDEEVEGVEPGAGGPRNGRAGGGGGHAASGLAAQFMEALAVLGLDGPVGRIELKRRYKELVKRHHPDANGGSRESEERLKLINRAYTYLRQQIAQ
jgi:DnaJ-domain-containing protein 1